MAQGQAVLSMASLSDPSSDTARSRAMLSNAAATHTREHCSLS